MEEEDDAWTIEVSGSDGTTVSGLLDCCNAAGSFHVHLPIGREALGA